jgi:seryl-tRNA synthetase
MLGRSFIRENLDLVEERLHRKGFEFGREEFLALDERERSARTEWEELRALRNRTSEDIARLKKDGLDATSKIEEMRSVGARIKILDERINELSTEVKAFLAGVPNLPNEDVPVGEDESSNRVEREEGTPRQFDFEVRDHVDLGASLGILDLERAAKITGARFATYFGVGARLERALANFMMDIHTREHGYCEVLPPFMANSRSFFGTGNLPKFEEDLFKIRDTDYYLVPTAEVPVTNIYAEDVLEQSELPLSYVAYTPCFRSEAGSYGKDTRGLIRQHQFNKVELVKFATPEDSYNQLEELTNNAEEILKRLELPYRVVTLSTGDMSFVSAKTYDLEVWIPSQQTYREISSCSNFEDYQARRANIRYKPADGKKTRLVHTLNGSGLAVGRTWVALIENYQEPDGSVVIPEALRPYMDGLAAITHDQVQS